MSEVFEPRGSNSKDSNASGEKNNPSKASKRTADLKLVSGDSHPSSERAGESSSAGLWSAVAGEMGSSTPEKAAPKVTTAKVFTSTSKSVVVDDEPEAEGDVEPESDKSTDELVTPDDVETEDSEVSPGPKSRNPRAFAVRNVVSLGIGLVAIILAVALALTMTQLSNKNSLENARTSAIAATKTYAVQVAGYNYKNLNKDFAAVEANSTPSYRKQFAQASAALTSTLTKFHATATAKVVAIGIISATASTATVLAFVDQTVTNTIQKGSTTDRVQTEFNLVKVNGKWLLNNVTIL